RAQALLLRLAQRDGAGDGGEGTPATVGGEAGELLDATGRLGLRAAADGPGRQRGGEPVRATVQQALQQRRTAGGIVPLAVEGRGEVTAAVDELRDLEQLGLDLLEDSLGLRLVQQSRDPDQLEGIEDVLLLGPAAPDDVERRLEHPRADPVRQQGAHDSLPAMLFRAWRTGSGPRRAT